MILRSPLIGTFAGLLLSMTCVYPAQGQHQPTLPSVQHSSVRSSAMVPTEPLSPVDTESLQSAPQTDRIGPYRYGTVLETNLTPDRHGVWERLPSGNWLWRLRLHSDEAVSLSVTFSRFQLPDGTTLYVHGPNGTDIRGPYTAADATLDQHWTPLVRGEILIVQMEVPRGQRPAVDLEIDRVVHGYRSLDPASSDTTPAKSGTCNLDVACEEADPWRNQVRSVGRYTFEDDGVAYACSGALVNSTGEETPPLFLTAEHCISTPAQAASMVFYWNYQNPTCRTPGTPENGEVTDDPVQEQTSSGAILRARYGNSHRYDDIHIAGRPDLALVEVDDEIPNSYDLYFSGWSRAGLGTTEGVTIHHPSGHGKRISFDRDPTTITAFGEPGGGNTHLRIGTWEIGTTESGSSGGPLFDTNHRIVGVLSGGFAGCGLDGDAEDNNRPDWYGRLAPGFETGDYQGVTLANWLDPANTGTTTLDGRAHGDVDDQAPPSRIEDLSVDSIGVTSMTLQWTAPGDDGDQGTAVRYDLRFSTSPIGSESEFQAAPSAQSLPPPHSAGTAEETTVSGLTPDSTYFFAIRAIDDGENPSPIGTTPSGTRLPDQIRPAAYPEVEVTDISTSDPAVTFRWIATGDDERRGAATREHLWFDTTPIEAPTDTLTATRVTLSNPVPAGQQQTATITGSDGLEQGNTYYFALAAGDNAGNRSPLATVEHKAVLVKDIEVEKGGLAGGTGNGVSETRFVLNETQTVKVLLYDLLGRRVRVLFNRRVQEGFEQTVRFRTNSLSTGPYFLRFVGENFATTRKIVVVH